MSEPPTPSGRALLEELSESPLPGARYARDVVALRLPTIEAQALGEYRRNYDAAKAREARDAVLDALEAAVLLMDGEMRHPAGRQVRMPVGFTTVNRAAVLEAINDQRRQP